MKYYFNIIRNKNNRIKLNPEEQVKMRVQRR